MKKIILLIPVFLLSGCYKPDNWTAFYYPDFNYKDYFTKQSGFIDLQACKDYAYNLGVADPENLATWDYECGKNCEYDSELKWYSCEETVK